MFLVMRVMSLGGVRAPWMVGSLWIRHCANAPLADMHVSVRHLMFTASRIKDPAAVACQLVTPRSTAADSGVPVCWGTLQLHLNAVVLVSSEHFAFNCCCKFIITRGDHCKRKLDLYAGYLNVLIPLAY